MIQHIYDTEITRHQFLYSTLLLGNKSYLKFYRIFMKQKIEIKSILTIIEYFTEKVSWFN